MKVIFVSNVSWMLFNFRLGLMTEIKDRGHEVIFCTVEDEFTSKLKRLGFKYIPIALDRKGKNVLKDLSLLLSLVKIYKKEKPDWVFHNTTKPFLYGTIAAYLTRRSCINTHSGLGYLFIKMGFLTKFLMIFYKLAGFCADKTFFLNEDDLQLFLNKRLVDPKKCALVPGDGIDTDYFSPVGNRNTKDSFVFLYAGRILWDKGIGELIDSVRALKGRYPSMNVKFLGRIDTENPAGISRSQVDEWVRKGIIEYLGNTDDVRPYLKDCNCVVLPSYREGVPKALLEAAAMELPIIATDVPGCRAVVEHGVNGLLVKVKDPIDLAGAMDAMMRMSDSQRKEMGKSGRAKIIREYSERLVIEAYCSEIGA